jgi:MinD-like ATPase involved in chromosome partitioning or flagellar assembly
MMVEALARTYDHVIIDAGTTFEAAVERLHRLAPRAVLVATAEMAAPTMAARGRLIAAGYGEIAVLDGAATAAAAAVAA